MKVFFILLLSVSLVCTATNPKLATLPANSWMILDSAGIDIGGRNAYSGGGYDRSRNRFMMFGGGHWDGYLNDVPIFDIATATWNIPYTADPGSAYTCSNVDTVTPGMLKSSGRPASRHTYDMIEYLDHVDKMVMWSGPTYSPLWSCPGNTLPKDTWLFDPATAKWSYGNQTRMTQPTGEAKCGAYCSFDSLYYAYSNDVFYSYNASLDKWSQVSLTGSYKPSGYDGSLIPSRKRAQFFMVNPKTVNNVSTHAVSVYDVASRSWSEQAVLPVGSMVYSGYDEVWDDLLIPNEGGSKFVVFHAKDSSVELITTKGVLPSMAGDRCYGRFFYDSADSVFLYIAVVNYKTRVYAYRYRRGAPVADVTPPTTPQNVNATALSDTVVQISWNLSTDPENPVTRYIVFSDGKEVGRTDTLTYRDSALTELTRYLYTVAAVNAVQMKSSQSTPAAVTTSANTIPPSLVTLSPLIARCSTIVLTFTEPLDSASAVNTTHYSLDNNGIVRGAALSADGKTVTLTSAPLSFTASYTITLNGITDRAKTPNAIAAGTKLLFTVPNAQLVVDYGASAAANRFGMAGWTRVIMDAYVGYMSNGPAGIYTEGSGGYDFRGVIGTPRLFKAGETISATWYNMQSYPITFTPKVSLRDSSRPANTNNGWRTMSTITIPPGRSLESIYTIDTASAGTYQVVNISSNYTPPGYPDRLMLCDRIEIFTIDSGTTSIDHLSGDGETGSELTVSPNPFNPSVNIRLSGVSVQPLQFRIYNLSGHCIAQLTSATNQGAVVWNADSEPSGIYLVVARSAGKTFSRKIILSK